MLTPEKAEGPIIDEWRQVFWPSITDAAASLSREGRVNATFSRNRRAKGPPAREETGSWLIRRDVFGATFLVTAFLIVTPLAALLHGSFQTGSPGMATTFTWKNWTDLGSGNIIHTLLITCFISAVTSMVSTIGGAGLTWLVYRSDFRFKRSLVATVGLSFFFPGFILAMAWVILASPGGIFNDVLDEVLRISHGCGSTSIRSAASSGSRSCISFRSRSLLCAGR